MKIQKIVAFLPNIGYTERALWGYQKDVKKVL